MSLNRQKIVEALNALIEYNKKASEEKPAEKKSILLEDNEGKDQVFVAISTKKFLSDKKDLKPKIAKIPHKIYDDSTSVCLFSKDPQRAYKDALQGEDSASKGVVTRVIGVSKLKGKFKSYEARRQLRNSYDLFVADDNVIRTLPKLLGKAFYGRNTKVPVPIKCQSSSGKEINATTVKNQINSLLNSTSYITSTGNNVLIRVGGPEFTSDQLADNIEAVVSQFVDKCLESSWQGLRAVNIKTASSPSLPIYHAETLYNDEDVIDEKPTKRKRVDKETDKVHRPSKLIQALSEVVDEEELKEFTSKMQKSDKKRQKAEVQEIQEPEDNKGEQEEKPVKAKPSKPVSSKPANLAKRSGKIAKQKA